MGVYTQDRLLCVRGKGGKLDRSVHSRDLRPYEIVGTLMVVLTLALVGYSRRLNCFCGGGTRLSIKLSRLTYKACRYKCHFFHRYASFELD